MQNGPAPSALLRTSLALAQARDYAAQVGDRELAAQIDARARAWSLRGIAAALPPGDPRRAELEQAAARHAAAGLALVRSGSYEGEHWLASFAVYLLGGSGLPAARGRAFSPEQGSAAEPAIPGARSPIAP